MDGERERTRDSLLAQGSLDCMSRGPRRRSIYSLLKAKPFSCSSCLSCTCDRHQTVVVRASKIGGGRAAKRTCSRYVRYPMSEARIKQASTHATITQNKIPDGLMYISIVHLEGASVKTTNQRSAQVVVAVSSKRCMRGTYVAGFSILYGKAATCELGMMPDHELVWTAWLDEIP